MGNPEVLPELRQDSEIEVNFVEKIPSDSLKDNKNYTKSY